MSSAKITLQVIADQLKVSKTLVSRALLGKYGVSDEMRKNILRTAIELGYPLPAKTKGSAADLTRNIAIVIPRSFLSDLSYWGAVLSALEAELQQEGYCMILAPVGPEIEEAELPTSIKERKVDGVFLLGNVADSLNVQIINTGLPVVMVDGHSSHDLKIDHVLADNFNGMADMTTYVLQAGHRRVAYIGDPAFSLSFAERLRGFQFAVNHFANEQNVINTTVISDISGEHNINNLEQALNILLSAPIKPTAVLCANDSIAINLLLALKSRGLKCPEDISVTGFDNINSSEPYALASVDAGKQDIAAHAVQLLMQRMHHRQRRPCTLYVTTELVDRRSIAKID
ncbi:MAG: LacI family DNA-binding transcriptional regulator [Candidatus Cohnella colombiensis]|uniref:LacI family DNA-binding transcriptional regulator n=1 Tax=Candidatus Cohnella colombiensis TaxID=3121368 RepID=A0AA95ETI3_9BACL|nr:MAG: LacI family DNA-binding transcriptional regulator [Cohnella sp.]